MTHDDLIAALAEHIVRQHVVVTDAARQAQAWRSAVVDAGIVADTTEAPAAVVAAVLESAEEVKHFTRENERLSVLLNEAWAKRDEAAAHADTLAAKVVEDHKYICERAAVGQAAQGCISRIIDELNIRDLKWNEGGGADDNVVLAVANTIQSLRGEIETLRAENESLDMGGDATNRVIATARSYVENMRHPNDARWCELRTAVNEADALFVAGYRPPNARIQLALGLTSAADNDDMFHEATRLVALSEAVRRWCNTNVPPRTDEERAVHEALADLDKSR